MDSKQNMKYYFQIVFGTERGGSDADRVITGEENALHFLWGEEDHDIIGLQKLPGVLTLWR